MGFLVGSSPGAVFMGVGKTLFLPRCYLHSVSFFFFFLQMRLLEMKILPGPHVVPSLTQHRCSLCLSKLPGRGSFGRSLTSK